MEAFTLLDPPDLLSSGDCTPGRFQSGQASFIHADLLNLRTETRHLVGVFINGFRKDDGTTSHVDTGMGVGIDTSKRETKVWVIDSKDRRSFECEKEDEESEDAK